MLDPVAGQMAGFAGSAVGKLREQIILSAVTNWPLMVRHAL